ncbi:hypothetical protein [Pontibacter saemangeumensis]|uniref:hypothetical protein n=1 Tax=Pontibacter saemangeumensis TaxID=1084525 RepID=UPI0031EBD08B
MKKYLAGRIFFISRARTETVPASITAQSEEGIEQKSTLQNRVPFQAMKTNLISKGNYWI